MSDILVDGGQIAAMPQNAYHDSREFAFDMLAKHLGMRPIELRVVMSNIFISMARQGRRRSNDQQGS